MWLMLIRMLLALVLLTYQITGQEIGESCKDRYTNQPGTCKLVDECPDVKEKANRGIAPTVCGFVLNTIAIVCCENGFDTHTKPIESKFETPPIKKGSSTINRNSKKSEKMCSEYARFTFESVVILPLVTIPEPTTLNVTRCEYEGIPLIVGGKPAAEGEFPFMAALGFEDNTFKCGGSLISEEFVLTAAHCVRTKVGPPNKVRLAEISLKETSNLASDYSIKEIYVHPQYKPPQKYNDIALIRLTEKVEFHKALRPACLYTKEQINQPKALAAGYGATTFGGDATNMLLKVALDLLDTSVCSNTFTVDKNLPRGFDKTMLCAGELRGSKDTCQGDSGGPLIITQQDNNCLHYIVGVTSFGRSCGAVNTPAVYTRISEFVPWIESIVWP